MSAGTGDLHPDDTALLLRLGAIAAEVDPVPDLVLEAGRAAFLLRRLDAELAELVADSATDRAGVRGGDDRLLSFEAGETSLELQVTARSGRPARARAGRRRAGGRRAAARRDRGRAAGGRPGRDRHLPRRPGARSLPPAPQRAGSGARHDGLGDLTSVTTLTRAAPADTSLLAEAEAAYRGVLVDAQAAREPGGRRGRRALDAPGAPRRWWWRCARSPGASTSGSTTPAPGSCSTRRCAWPSAAACEQRLGEVLVSRAAVSHELGRLTAAQHDLDRATDLVGPDAGVEVLVQQAALHQNIGHLAQAARRPPAGARAAGLPAGRPVQDAEQPRASRRCSSVAVRRPSTTCERAVLVGEQVGPVAHAIASQSRAWVTMQVGRLSESLQLFEQAGELYERAGLPLDEHFVEYADALIGLRLVPEAQDVARRAVDGAGQARRTAHGGRGAAAGSPPAPPGRRRTQAELAARAALAQLRRQGRTSWVARADVVLAEAEAPARSGRRWRRCAGCSAPRRRWSGWGCASTRSRATSPPAGWRWRAAARPRRSTACSGRRDLARGAPVLVRLRGRVAAALAAQESGDVPAVLRACRAGLDDLAEHQLALPSVELRALASGHGAELGRIGLRAALPERECRPGPRLDGPDAGCGTRARRRPEHHRPRGRAGRPALDGGRARARLGRWSRAARPRRAHRSRGAPRPPRLLDRQRRSRRRAADVPGPPSCGRRSASQALVVYASLDGVLTAVVLEPSGLRLVRLSADRGRRRRGRGDAVRPAPAHAPQVGRSHHRGASQRRGGEDPAGRAPGPAAPAGARASPWSSSRAPTWPACRGRPCTTARRPWRPRQRCGCARWRAGRPVTASCSSPAPGCPAQSTRSSDSPACTPAPRCCSRLHCTVGGHDLGAAGRVAGAPRRATAACARTTRCSRRSACRTAP